MLHYARESRWKPISAFFLLIISEKGANDSGKKRLTEGNEPESCGIAYYIILIITEYS